MIAVIIIIGIGIGLIAGGFYYHLFDDILIDFFASYVYDTSNVYYIGSQFIWDAIPWVMILVGLLCFILAGLYHHYTSMAGGYQ